MAEKSSRQRPINSAQYAGKTIYPVESERTRTGKGSTCDGCMFLRGGACEAAGTKSHKHPGCYEVIWIPGDTEENKLRYIEYRMKS